MRAAESLNLLPTYSTPSPATDDLYLKIPLSLPIDSNTVLCGLMVMISACQLAIAKRGRSGFDSPRRSYFSIAFIFFAFFSPSPFSEMVPGGVLFYFFILG